MLNKKPETIHNFLTPTKLITGMTKPGKQNIKSVKSPQNSDVGTINNNYI